MRHYHLLKSEVSSTIARNVMVKEGVRGGLNLNQACNLHPTHGAGGSVLE